MAGWSAKDGVRRGVTIEQADRHVLQWSRGAALNRVIPFRLGQRRSSISFLASLL